MDKEVLKKWLNKDLAYIKVLRDQFNISETLGNCFINGAFFGHTLEDPVRPNGIKIKHNTAIQPGIYIVTVRVIRGRKRVCINNVPLFTDILAHGGNHSGDTSGCVLVAENRYQDRIQGTLEAELVQIVESAKFAYIEIVNLTQLDP